MQVMWVFCCTLLYLLVVVSLPMQEQHLQDWSMNGCVH